nr:uncharacterized protein LOC109173053 [Ipomoea batatas]
MALNQNTPTDATQIPTTPSAHDPNTQQNNHVPDPTTTRPSNHHSQQLEDACAALNINDQEAKDLSNNTFLFQFFHDIDMLRALNDGPWSFEQNLLILAKAQPNIPPAITPLDTADFWIQLHDLPLGFYSEKSVTAIGNFIGEFLKIDEATFSGWWQSFIRIRVRINITKPLASGMRIRRNGGDWSWVSFRYERLPNFCFICGLIGHTEKFCIKLFEGFSPTAEKHFGPWLRAPSRRPSPVTGNRWVVSEQDSRNVTSNLSSQSQDRAAEGAPLKAPPAPIVVSVKATFHQQIPLGFRGDFNDTLHPDEKQEVDLFSNAKAFSLTAPKVTICPPP